MSKVTNESVPTCQFGKKRRQDAHGRRTNLTLSGVDSETNNGAALRQHNHPATILSTIAQKKSDLGNDYL